MTKIKEKYLILLSLFLSVNEPLRVTHTQTALKIWVFAWDFNRNFFPDQTIVFHSMHIKLGKYGYIDMDT